MLAQVEVQELEAQAGEEGEVEVEVEAGEAGEVQPQPVFQVVFLTATSPTWMCSLT